MAASAASAPLPSVRAAVAAGPFKFLDYYADTLEDQRRFGGRDREIRELSARITSERTLVLYGPSGVGKTSLMLAGVFPELRSRDYLPVYVRTLSSPVLDLCRALRAARELPAPEEDGCDLAGSLAAESHPVAIVLDQFEEFFIHFAEQPAVRQSFVAAVAGLVNDRSLALTVVFSLRQDYLADLDEFRERIPSMLGSEYRLKPLTAFGVRQAVTRALADSQVPYDEAIVASLVDQLEGVGFDPAALQILCSELYREAVSRPERGPARITAADLAAVGSLSGIFRRYLDSATAAVPEERHLLVRMILDALITRDNAKRAATFEDLLSAHFAAVPDEVREILDTLESQRLLRQYERDGRHWYELVHERLVPIVREWLDRDRRFSDFRRARTFIQVNSENEIWRDNPEALLNQGLIDELLLPFRDRFRFEPRQAELVLRSVIYRRLPLAEWVHQLGAPACGKLVEGMMASPDARVREGAAAAAGQLPDPAHRLAAFCLKTSLEDPDDRVRRAAGLALAPLAQPEHLAEVRAALSRRGRQRRARDLVVSLREGRHPLRGLPWWHRQLARVRARQRVLHERDEVRRRRRKVGLRAGLNAALAWCGTVGIAVALAVVGLVSAPTTGTLWFSEMLLALLSLLGVSLVLGAGFGWAAAAAGARHAAVHGNEKWHVALSPLRGWALVPALAAGLLGGILALLGSPSDWSVVLLWAAISWWLMVGLLPGVAGWLAGLVKPVALGWVRAGAHDWTLARIVVASAGVPLLLVLVTNAVVSQRFRTGALLASAPIVSLLTCVSTFALACSARAHPLAAPTSRWLTPRRRRWLLFGPPLLTAPVFVLFHGIGVDLGAESPRDFDPARDWEYSWQPPAGRPAVRYFVIRNPAGEQLVQLKEVTDSANTRFGAMGPQEVGAVLLLPPGEHWCRFRAGGRQPVHKVALSALDPVEAGAASEIDLGASDKALVRVPLSPIEGRTVWAVWACSIGGRMARPREGPGRVEVSFSTTVWGRPWRPTQRLMATARDSASNVHSIDFTVSDESPHLSPVGFGPPFLAAVDAEGRWKVALEIIDSSPSGDQGSMRISSAPSVLVRVVGR